HQLTATDQIYGRVSFFKDLANPVKPLPEGSGNITSGVLGLTDTRAQSLVLNYAKVFRSNFVNEFRFGYTRRTIDREATQVDSTLPGIPANAVFPNTLPTFTISGFQQLGSPANTASEFRTDVTQAFDAVSWQHGRHSFKFGFDFRWERLDVLQPPSPTGTFAFSTLFTNSQGIPTVGTPASSFTGNSLASFLLGQVQTFSIDLQQSVLQ